MAKKKTNQAQLTMPKKFSLIAAIRGEKQLYKANVVRRDKIARQKLENTCPHVSPNTLKKGSLYMMEYFEPQTADQLEYYDAKPCVIFFGNYKTKEGEPRVIGFNVHYYPPRIRFKVLDKVMDIFKPFYKKFWSNKDPKESKDFDYAMIIYQLQKAKLEFGVRQYVPKLIGKCQLIEPKDWQKAVFTEGRFKKRTRDAIIKYWKNKPIDKQLITRVKKAGYKKTGSGMSSSAKIK